jgi:hypothetical protein
VNFTLTRLDARPIPGEPGEIRALIVERNERSRLAWLLQYYRGLGVDRFLVVDNASTDGTPDMLLEQHDVHVWHTPDSYAASEYGRYWLDRIRADHGSGHWCIVVDADEMLVYPFSERIGLRDLTTYMTRQGHRGVFSFMLDMYPAGPLRKAVLTEGQSFLEVADHFDIGPYFIMPGEERFPRLGINGGLRRRIFYQSGITGRGPNLRKVPLILWQPGDEYRSAHSCSDIPLTDVTGALLHFKYFSDFHEKAEIESQRKEHVGGGDEYAIYHRLLSQMPDVSFLSELSRRFISSAELVKLQLLICSRPYIEFCRNRIKERDGDGADLSDLNEIADLLRNWEVDLRLPFGVLTKLWRLPEIR